MKIILVNGLEWDDALAFEQQEQDVVVAVEEIMASEGVRTTNTFCGRCEREVWLRDGYSVVRDYRYLVPETASNCYALSCTVVTVQPQ